MAGVKIRASFIELPESMSSAGNPAICLASGRRRYDFFKGDVSRNQFRKRTGTASEKKLIRITETIFLNVPLLLGIAKVKR
jgi:hypothetical protein